MLLLSRGLALPMIGWAGVLVFLLSFLLRGGRRSILSSIALVIGAAGLGMISPTHTASTIRDQPGCHTPRK